MADGNVQNLHTTQTFAGGVSIDKLDGIATYNCWKFQMRMALTLEGLWDCVLGTDEDPTRGHRALARICLAVKPCCVQYIRNATTAKEAWNNLEKTFEDKGLFRRVVLLRKLHHMSYTEFKSMAEYIDAVMTTVQQLADIGRTVDDKEVAELLLSGLPQEYDTLVSGLEALNLQDNLTSETVRARLLQEDFRRNNNLLQQNGNGETAFATNKKIIICNYCKKPGHIKSKCFKLIREKKKQKEDTSTVSVLAAFSSDDWIVDSGCTTHMCKNKQWFVDLDINKKFIVTVANNEKLNCNGIGNVYVMFPNNVKKTISNVMYVPYLSTNLLSVNRLTQNGYSVKFDNNVCLISDNKGQVIASANNCNGIYKLNVLPAIGLTEHCSQNTQVDHRCSGMVNDNTQEAAYAVSPELWHKRLGHLSYKGMCALRDKLADGVHFSNVGNLKDCESCIKGKQAMLSFPKGKAKRAHRCLELIHSDVCGPMSESSWGGHRYLLTFTDDFSRKTFGYLMKNKNEVMFHFRNFKNLVEKQLDCYIKCLRTDGGGEFCNKNFEIYLTNNGIVHQTTIPYSPQQNGIAERVNRTLMEKTRCMLLEANLGKRYWGEAVMTAIYLKNRSPTAAVPGATPEQIWTGSKVNLDHLRVFGSKVFSLMPSCARDKLDSKSKEYIFVGYCNDSKGYRLIDPQCPNKIIKSRNVHFIESSNSNLLSNEINSDNNKVIFNNTILYNCDKVVGNNNSNNANNLIINNFDNNQNISVTSDGVEEAPCIAETNTSRSSSDSDSDDVNESNILNSDPVTSADEQYLSFDSGSTVLSPNQLTDGVSSPEQCLEEPSRPLRSTRGNIPKRYNDYELDLSLFAHNYVLDEPQSYEEAMASQNKADWQQAMQNEYDSLIKNGVWELVDRPHNHNVIKCRWVYKVKQDTKGNFDKFKARLVARGFDQKPGVDYDQTFSPVVRHSTMRILFSLANEMNMDIDHIDVATAFLHSNLQEKIFMEQPSGFECNNKNKVCLLRKSLYGLKQASRAWNQTVHDLLTKHGYTQTKNEPCVYYLRQNNNLTIIAVYVDDFFIFSNCDIQKNNLINILSNNFCIKNLGPVKNCLGMNIYRDRSKGILILKQSEYIKKLLNRFNMQDCKNVATPMQVNEKFDGSSNSNLQCEFNYRELIGCLMYLCVCTRPDISFCCSRMSQFNNCFTSTHCTAAKRILRYLHGTIDHGLVFTCSKNLNLVSYADADWANDPSDRKSYTGYVIKLGNNSVNWESRKQQTVALSSTEAEYIAMSDTCRDIMFIRQFVYEVIGKYLNCKIYNDNQSALKLLNSKECHRRTKHIDVRYHFMKDLRYKNVICFEYLQTNEMIADILTKALSKVKHYNFMKSLNVRT